MYNNNSNQGQLKNQNLKITLNHTSNNAHPFPSDTRSSQDQTTQLIAKINSLAKQLRSEQSRNESLEKFINNQKNKLSNDDVNSRVYAVHKEALQRQVNELTERLMSKEREVELSFMK